MNFNRYTIDCQSEGTVIQGLIYCLIEAKNWYSQDRGCEELGI